jgi:hypothetical protein
MPTAKHCYLITLKTDLLSITTPRNQLFYRLLAHRTFTTCHPQHLHANLLNCPPEAGFGTVIAPFRDT